MSKTTQRKPKQDDKFSLAIREIQGSSLANKKCFDCDQRGPTYINMTIGSFVCTKCSGMLRGINPPHRIKSISMSSFTSDEVEMMRSRGNLWCAAVWLGTYDKASQPVDFKDEEKIKEFIIAKFEKKRYYVEPSQASLSKIGTHASNSSGSVSEAKTSLTSSSLIGSTLKARVDPSSLQGANISISRPEPDRSNSVGRKPELPKPSPTVPLPSAASIPAAPTYSTPNGTTGQTQESEGFQANFADFDSVAFESLPVDPLTVPSVPLLASQQPLSKPTDKVKEQTTGEDRYSALKELDDLFKCTTIQSSEGGLFGPQESAPPVFSDQPQQANVFPDPYSGGSLFSPAATTAPVSVFPATAQPEQHNGSPGWANAGWGGRAASPLSTTRWGGTGTTPGTTPGGTTFNWGGDWPASDTQQPSHSTNPFGNSPSNPPVPASQSYQLDNNNDLFAAAPKPFIGEKSVVPTGHDLNPWLNVPAFTADMKPAPNPNNPFL